MQHLNAALPALPEDREPQQNRSRASFTRMLNAARRLLIDRGSDDFALSDVSRVGRVSIGSIYHRFQSKEELLRAVHRRLMQELHEEQTALVAKACDAAHDLPSLLAILLNEVAEFLKRNAGALRPMMACANRDSAIATAGKASYFDLQNLFTAALMNYRAAIRHADPHAAAATCLTIAYAAIARDLGFEAAHSAADPAEWVRLKESLFAMCTAFLVSPPAVSFADALQSSGGAGEAPSPPSARLRKSSAPRTRSGRQVSRAAK